MKRIPFSGRAAIVCALILAIGVPTTAMGFGEGKNLLLGKRNPSSNASRTLTSETEIIASNSTYGTRQSNKGTGGGAIYGCRAPAATAAAPSPAGCVRASNLNGGQAFQFTTTGQTAGTITTANPSGAPFTTNATGVATGLNADKVDGKDATDFASASDLANKFLFAIVSDNGTDAPTVTGPNAPTVTEATVNGNAVYTVDLKKDVSKCSYTASPSGSAGTAPGVAAVSGQANQVAVNLGASSAPAPNRGSFHLQVIC
jgi:hypothetical protein